MLPDTQISELGFPVDQRKDSEFSSRSQFKPLIFVTLVNFLHLSGPQLLLSDQSLYQEAWCRGGRRKVSLAAPDKGPLGHGTHAHTPQGGAEAIVGPVGSEPAAAEQ